MDLTIGNLKEVLLDTIGKDLIDNGFEFSKGNFTFIKKNGKNKCKAFFFFYDYKPSYLQYQFQIECTIDSIRREVLRFSEYSNISIPSNTGFFIEGHFHPSTKDKEPKYQSAYCHQIYDLSKSEIEINISREIFKDYFLPRLADYSNIENFQQKYLSTHLNAESYKPIASLLMGAKLMGFAELEKLVIYLNDKLHIDELSNYHQEKIFFSMILPYAKAYPKPA